MSEELDQAYKHCRRITRARAKNFYYAISTLPPRKRRAIYATYAFCRACDDIADGDGSVEDKKNMLGRTRELLHRSRSGFVQDPVFTALRDATTTYDIPPRYFDEIIDGVEMDLTWTRFESFDQLRAYCYRVASAVGLICIEVFGYSGPTAVEYAVDLGLAMQLTNIIRDVKEDAGRGRIYIPLDEIESFGYSEQELMEGVVNDAFRDLMKFQVDRAREFYDSGRRLVPLISPASRPCVSVLQATYGRILERVESSDFDVFQRRIGLSQREKLLLTAKLWAASLITTVLPQRR